MFPLALLGMILLLGAAANKGSTKPSPQPELPDGDFEWTQEDDEDLILEDDEGEFVYEGSGLEGFPVEQMKSIQFYLAELDFYFGDMHGLYDSATETAIASFQSWVNLPSTGYPDPDTLATLAEVITGQDPYEEPPAPAPTVPDAPAPNILIEYGFYPTNTSPDLEGVPYPRIVVRGSRVSLEDKLAAVAPFADAYPDVWFIVYQYGAGNMTNVAGYATYNQFTIGNASSNATLPAKIQETLDLVGM
jgi:peptidoglycan hydrolase-like protein with peptidoglycan-binding domain